MARGVCLAVALFVGAPCGADELEGSALRMTIGANEYLVAGSEAVRAGQFDDGIRLTLIGLERGNLGTRDRAAGLGNLCAAYVSKSEPDDALPYCDRSLQLDDRNWRVYTARARAYFLKGMFAEAKRDNDAAAAINPSSAHVKELRGKLNEQLLRPEVILEDHH
jgi:tetratricopeptide (TPR) repeat protein